MKTIATKLVAILSLALAAGLATGCGDDGDEEPFPTIGTQIDRSGRPAISTALVSSLLFANSTEQNTVKDQYNGDGNAAGWAAAWTAEIDKNIAVLDGLDGSAAGGNGCGNQFGFDGGGAGTDYDFLAGALADDRLVIDSSSTTCTNYLAVEAGVAGDCGGRTPLMDVVTVSYTVLATGGAVNIPQGPTTDDATHSATTFPFLAAP